VLWTFTGGTPLIAMCVRTIAMCIKLR
jgi:hypothetical protein